MTQDKAPEWAIREANNALEGTMAHGSPLFIGRVALALSQAYERGQVDMRERAAVAADEREAICADAVAKIEAGELYVGIDTAKATEGCARLEASHIARLIRSLPIDSAGKDDLNAPS